MTDTTTGGVSVPDKQPYRVVIVGASYRDPIEGLGPDGQPSLLQVYRVAGQGEIIDLTADEARRLEALGAVKEADAPAAYSELDQDALQAEVDERGILVRGSGVNGEALREDLVVALENYDRATQSQELSLQLADQAAPAVAPDGGYVSESKDALQAEADRRGLTVQGTGAGGNVTKDDLVAALVLMAIPVNTVAPALSGTPAAGQALSCTIGTWTGAEALESVWLRNGRPISGTRAEGDQPTTYPVASGDVGQQISCQVTARNSTGSAVAVSNMVMVTRPVSSSGGAGFPDWAPFTYYGALQALRAPDGSLVRALAQHTSGAVYDQTLYLYIAGKSVVGYNEARADQATISGATDLTGLALPSFTITAGDPAVWVRSKVSYWVPTTVGGQAVHSLVRGEDSTVWGSAWSPKATVVNDNVSGTIVEERISTPGTYTFRARGQAVGGGTVTMKAATRISAYIIAQREV